MQPKERTLSAIRHVEPDAVPYEMRMDPSVMRRVDEYYDTNAWRELVDNDIRRVRSYQSGTSGPSTGDGSETTWHDAYGSLWRRGEGAPRLEQPALTELDPDALVFPAMESVFAPEWRRQAEETIQANRDHFLITGIDFGVQDRTLLLRGYEAGLMDMIADEGRTSALMARLTDHLLEVVDVMTGLPVDGIMIGDDWGEQRGVVVGPDRWRRLIKPHVARLMDRIRGAGKVTMAHCCGNCSAIVPDLIEVGLDVLESVQPEAMDPYELKREYGDRITFWGGLGSQTLMPYGSPGEIREEVRRLATEMGRGGGYILSPAKTLLSDTPTANAVAAVKAFVEAKEGRLPDAWPEPA